MGPPENEEGRKEMKKVNYSRGPWETPREYRGEWVISYQGESGKIRTIAHVYDGEEFGSMEANARLIAAAPDLLEACEWALTLLKNNTTNKGQTVYKLENAIARTRRRGAVGE